MIYFASFPSLFSMMLNFYVVRKSGKKCIWTFFQTHRICTFFNNFPFWFRLSIGICLCVCGSLYRVLECYLEKSILFIFLCANLHGRCCRIYETKFQRKKENAEKNSKPVKTLGNKWSCLS